MAFEVRDIKETEREECLALWMTVWPGDGDSYFRRYFYGDVEWLPYYTQVGVLDGRLVSAVHICRRTVACGEYRLTMGGIANVATLPEYRGHGYNTECLKRAIRVMEADAMDFSLLFTGINAYYARQGFATVAKTWLSGTIRPDFAPRESEITVRPVRGADLPGIFRCYRAYNRLRPLAVQRTPAYWRDWIGISETTLPQDLLVAVDAAGVVCGYVQTGTFRSALPYSPDAVGIRVNELGIDSDQMDQEGSGFPARPSGQEILIVLLEAIAAQILAAGGNEMRLEISLEPLVQTALQGILSDIRQHHDISGMMRLLNRDTLLVGLSMEWTERWLQAGRPTGAVAFETPYGPVSIDGSGALLRVEPTEQAAETLSQSVLFELICGALLPSEASANRELYPLLAALFPLRGPVYYGSDGF